jgi:hypothetical protein
MDMWDVLPDTERKQWTLDPFKTVGPLAFGMTPDEATSALGGIPWSMRSHDPHFRTARYHYFEEGLWLYYAPDGGLCGVSADARKGPQVFMDGRALVGQVPSVLEQWISDREESREWYSESELAIMPGGEVASLTLGVVFCVQRSGDRLLTRPVFLPADSMDDVFHQLPREAWAIF